MRFTIHIGLIALISLLNTGSSRGATTIDSLFYAAEQQVGKVSLKESIATFRDILSRDDAYAPAYNALANLYLQANTVNDRQRAMRMIQQAIAIAPNNTEYRLTRGKIWWAQGFQSRALNQYENVSEKHPDNTEALNSAGMYWIYDFLAQTDRRSQYHSKDFKIFAQEAKREAEKTLRKSIQLDAMNQKSYYLLGILYFEDEDWRSFQALMQDLHAQYPDDKNVLLFCGLAHYQLGEYNESHEYYQRAYDLMSVEERELLESIDLLVLKEDHAPRDTMQTIDELLEREMFWKSQDPLYLSDFNERKMEHFGRMAYSNLRFKRFSANVEGWQTDMGKTYIKFGRYRRRISGYGNCGKTANLIETWFYETFKIEFCGDGADRWSFGGGDEVGGVSFIPPDGSLFDYWDEGPENAFRQRTFSFSSTPQEASHHTFRKIAQRFVDPYLKRKYTLPYQVVAFEERDSVRVELSYMIPKNRLESNSETGEVSFWDSVFLFDEHWNDVYNYRKSVSFKRKPESYTVSPQKPTQNAAAQHRNDHLLVSRMLSISQGNYHFSVELLDQTSGAIGIARDKEQYVYDDETFHLSDLLVGSNIQARRMLPEGRDDLIITPNPVRTFSTSESVFIYLELYDLKRDNFGSTQYEISYTIGKPEVDTLSPTLFASQDLIDTMGKTEIDLRSGQGYYIASEGLLTGQSQDIDETGSVFADSDIWGETKVYTSGGQVHHIAAEDLKIERSKDGDLTRTVTADYEGNREDDFTYLQIDVNQVPEGIYQLTVLAKDKRTDQTDRKYVYFRIVE